ncbi:hypothetical protein NMG60_11009427 [Bertholletia excelsa]
MKEPSHDLNILDTNPLSQTRRASIFSAYPPEETIFGGAFLTAFSLLQLPYERINGNPVPTVIFKDKPSFFHAFLLALNVAFSSAVITMSLRDICPRLTRHSRRLSIVSMATAVGIVGWLVLASSFSLL